MIILGIETSCDETAISIIEADPGSRTLNTKFTTGQSGKLGGGFSVNILANEVLSQIDIHRQYGGVFPMVAKREHSRNLVPLLKLALEKAGFGNSKSQAPNLKQIQNSKSKILNAILEREPELLEQFEKEISKIQKPPIDAIAVTKGPGLEPALWTGINFAKALSAVWNIPLIPINHMEGHMFASLLSANIADKRGLDADHRRKKTGDSIIQYQISDIKFPAIALLISGGHTELIEIKNWFDYKILGATRDDAVGEAFDKVARILGLPYPGGPQISALAEIARNNAEQTPNNAEINTNSSASVPHNFRVSSAFHLPRPMINSPDYDFSFSGLKTSVLYLVKKLESESQRNNPRASASFIRDNPRLQMEIAREFEDAVVEVLVAKTLRAISETNAKTLIVGGGVAANKFLRQKLAEMARQESAEIFISEISHSTDNALMIAVAGAVRYQNFGEKSFDAENFRATGGLKIDS